MDIKIEVSVGELLDKITILEIKKERIIDPEKTKNINKELAILKKLWQQFSVNWQSLDKEINALKQINEKLWEIEDKIRNKEKEKAFDQEFIELARSVYFANDERSKIKRNINIQTASELIEEKSYSEYD